MDAQNKLGKRIISSLITEEKRIKLEQYLKDRPRTRMIRQVSDARTSHLEDILQICLQHISPVTAPLAVVSQISYSGGITAEPPFGRTFQPPCLSPGFRS